MCELQKLQLYIYIYKPFALIYRIYYKLMGTQMNPSARIPREPSGKTMLIQCSTLDAKSQVLVLISLPLELAF